MWADFGGPGRKMSLARLRGAKLQATAMNAVGQLTGGIAHTFSDFLGAALAGFDPIRRRIEPSRFRNFAAQGASRERRRALGQFSPSRGRS